VTHWWDIAQGIGAIFTAIGVFGGAFAIRSQYKQTRELVRQNVREDQDRRLHQASRVAAWIEPPDTRNGNYSMDVQVAVANSNRLPVYHGQLVIKYPSQKIVGTLEVLDVVPPGTHTGSYSVAVDGPGPVGKPIVYLFFQDRNQVCWEQNSLGELEEVGGTGDLLEAARRAAGLS